MLDSLYDDNNDEIEVENTEFSVVMLNFQEREKYTKNYQNIISIKNIRKERNQIAMSILNNSENSSIIHNQMLKFYSPCLFGSISINKEIK